MILVVVAQEYRPCKMGNSMTWKLVPPDGWNLSSGGGETIETLSLCEMHHANSAETAFMNKLQACPDM